jgi:putative transposase
VLEFVFDQRLRGSVAKRVMWYHQPFSRTTSLATISFKGRHVQQEMILQRVRWSLADALSDRDLEALMAERGFSVDHRTLNRGVVHDSPQRDAAFRRKKQRVGGRWRMDETSITVKGPGTYSDRAVEKQGTTIDCLFPATRDRTAARRCFKNAITNTGTPSLVTSEQRGAHTAGVQQVNREPHTRSMIRQCTYLNKMIEHDHRRITRLTRPMLGFKTFYAAQRTSGLQSWR